LLLQGCSSDVPAHFYSLSTDLKADWTSSHPLQPDIEDYLKQLTDKYSLSSHIVFGCKVITASWDPTELLYHIQTEDVLTGKQSTTTAQVVISAVGILEIPRYPEIKGMPDFRGTMFHSARWTDTELRGKRVAVIGNGASA
jgi:cation diffusion facilitator CzcD-associated flavoprotein CzcO